MAAGPLISIIDDDESMRSAIVALVRSARYQAHGFASADEFLGCGKVEGYAGIITDIQMPGMSGIELKQHLAACQSAVPVIMITARHDPGLEQKALASGAACFLRTIGLTRCCDHVHDRKLAGRSQRGPARAITGGQDRFSTRENDHVWRCD